MARAAPTAAPGLTGLVLAGGQARRLQGHDKGLLPLHGQALVAHVVRRLQPQVTQVLINANRHLHLYARWGTVLADAPDLPAQSGPLLGLATGLRASPTPWLLCVPCDSPWLPLNLATQLWRGLATASATPGQPPARLAAAWANGRRQGVFLLVHRNHLPSLEAWLHTGGRKVDSWLEQEGVHDVDFNDPQAFRNLNTPQDWPAGT